MKRILIALLVMGFAFTGVAFAKEVSGKVAGIEGNKLWISSWDAAGAEQKSEIWVNEDAAFTGIAALAELKEGDQVTVEAEELDGNWKASKVTKA